MGFTSYIKKCKGKSIYVGIYERNSSLSLKVKTLINVSFNGVLI